MPKIYLNKNNFLKVILKNNGYINEHIPFCFNTADLANKWDDIKDKVINLINNNRKGTYPISISVSKSGFLRRTIHIPNILSFLDLAIFISKNWDFIIKKCKSKASESKIYYISSFDYPSNYKRSIFKRNARFVGYKYKLKLDISNCYNSIYTHSITWAFVGKENVKEMYLNKSIKTSEYDLGDKIDSLNRKMNADQTNGILTGPFTSRISSEIVLCEIDRLLEKENFDFVRYVDDYNFYFITQTEAENAIPKIANILNEYNLLINKEKLQIQNFPFDKLENYSQMFKFENDKENIYYLLQKVFSLPNEQLVGAMKYLLKSLSNKNINSKMFPQIYGLLINTIISYPLLSPYIVNVIELYLPIFKPEKFVKQMNKILSNELKSNHEHEILWLLYIMLKSEILIFEENLRNILQSESDLAIIMCLDYLNNNFRKAGYKNIQEVSIKFGADLDLINKRIKDYTMLSKNWLLLYTIAKLNLTCNARIKVFDLRRSKMYKVFADSNINFYKSFYNTK